MNLNVNNIEQVQCKVLARAHNEERTRTRTRRLTQKSRKKYIAVFVLDARGKLKLKVCVIVYANVRVKYRATHIREKRHRTTRAGCKRAKEKKIGQKKKINSNNNTKLDFLCTHQSIREPVRYCVRCSVRFIHDMAEVVCVTWLN